MEDFGSLIGAIALWIGLSCGLWWVHRRRLHSRQDRQLEQAQRAIALIAEAPAVFDAIRTLGPTPDDGKAATLGLLKRIQEQGGFFDTVHGLKVQLQASLGIDDHAALSEILNLRRDLWASSEILLVDDPAALGPSFAEPGAFERIRGEAAHLLFKLHGPASDDDLIDLRVSLAQEEARSFADALAAAIRDAREKDRLPTWSEVVAYPLAFLRAIPRTVRTAFAFVAAFFAYSADAARAIRESETVARGKSRLLEARQDWPERLSASFERASHTARGSGAALRRHYDFLVTAYDFQTKYEDVLRRAPDVTERGRQFIARLELAERSERLRLTSANATVWLARRLLDGSAHALAAAQSAAAWLSETTLGNAAATLLAPVPSRGRGTPAFPSYAMALAASGLSETRPQPVSLPPLRERQAAAKGKSAAKGKATGKPAPAASRKKAAIAAKPATGAKAAAAPVAKVVAAPVAKPAKAPSSPSAAKAEAPARPSWRFFAIYATKGEPAADAPAKPVAGAPAKATVPPASAKASLKPIKASAQKAVAPIAPAKKGKAAKPQQEVAPLPRQSQPVAAKDAVASAIPEPQGKTAPAKPALVEPVPAPPLPAAAKEAARTVAEPQAKATPAKLPVVEPTPASPPPALAKGAVIPAAAEPRAKAAPAKPPIVEAPPAPPPPAVVKEAVIPAVAEPRAKAAPATPIIVEAAPAPLPDAAPVTPSPEQPIPLPDEDDAPLPPKRPSFLKRLFGPSKARVEREAQQEAERLAEALAEALSAGEIGAPLPEGGGAPTLMAKLSSLEATTDAPDETEAPDDFEEEAELVEEEPAEEGAIEPQDEPGPLTLSIMELQAKIGAKPPPIRSFPWLRG